MRSTSLEIKYIFLSFLQQYFKAHPRYTWAPDERITKVIIADKFAVDRSTPAKRPSILLSRDGFRWSNTYRQDGVVPRKGFRTTADKIQQTGTLYNSGSHTFTDLLQGGVTIQIIAQRPTEADDLANIVYQALTAYRDLLKPKGIHQITNMSLSEERPLSVGAEITLSAVTMSVGFVAQMSVSRSEEYYKSSILIADTELFEGINYSILPGGSQIQFLEPVPAEATPQITYIDAITLEEHVKKNLLPVDGSSILYVVPENKQIYGYYKIFEHAEFTITQDDD